MPGNYAMRIGLAAFGIFMILFGTKTELRAQASRYEMGVRLKLFEAAWEKGDKQRRMQAVQDLSNLTQLFFSFKFGQVGFALDNARAKIEQENRPSAAWRWANSLTLDPGQRLRGPAESFAVKLESFYPVTVPFPENLFLEVQIPGEQKQSQALKAIPARCQFRLPKSAQTKEARWGAPLQFLIKQNDRVLVSRTISLSVLAEFQDDPVKRSKELRDLVAKKLPRESWENRSALMRIQQIQELAEGLVFETDYSALKLLDEVNEMLKTPKHYFTAQRSGDQWVSLPTSENRSTIGRLWIPEKLPEQSKVPLVIALHGAGGSENLFFEGYGSGEIVRQVQKRSWLLFAPRSPALFGGAPALKEIIAELSKRLPIDPNNVFVVGHSMGALQAMESVQKTPELIRGVAVLGGSGIVRNEKLFQELPLFIGIGDKDFALKGAQRLRDTIQKISKKFLNYQEYSGVEHMLIVRVALPDLFAFFDRHQFQPSPRR